MTREGARRVHRGGAATCRVRGGDAATRERMKWVAARVVMLTARIVRGAVDA